MVRPPSLPHGLIADEEIIKLRTNKWWWVSSCDTVTPGAITYIVYKKMERTSEILWGKGVKEEAISKGWGWILKVFFPGTLSKIYKCMSQ